MQRSVARTTRGLRAFVLLAIVGASSCQEAMRVTEPSQVGDELSPVAATSTRIPNAARPLFIVTLVAGHSPTSLATEHGVAPEHVYRHALNGFAGEISEAARSGLLRDARVVRVERDVTVAAQVDPQTGAPWGLDRIDQRTSNLDGLYSYQRTGAGVTAYVVDSGIRYSHEEFEGRARFGYDAFGGDGSDCSGHGTHVAGTVGGAIYGVAKQVDLVSVRVLNCDGWGGGSGLIAGLDWIMANHSGAGVVNMSLAFPNHGSVALDEAVERMITSGITVVAAAANYRADACDYSPAHIRSVITVASIGPSDRRSAFSNWGRCVDWFAPGDGIASASSESDVDITLKSGTSMAAPHTTGVAALYLQNAPDASPQEVATALSQWTTKGVVEDAQSRNADVLYSLGDTVTEAPDVNEAPTSTFSYECDALTCQFADESSDHDGVVTTWSWDFGTGGSIVSQNPAHTFPGAGSYRVRLTVTDDEGAEGSSEKTVTLDQPTTGLRLIGNGYKDKGRHHVTLEWFDAEGEVVDLYRDGMLVASPSNPGTFLDVPNGRGRALYRYQICERDTDKCSAESRVTF